jgi:two-component system NtrC family sensor kinase
MNTRSSKETRQSKLPPDFYQISYRILRSVNQRLSKIEFMKETLNCLLDVSGCGSVLMWLKNGEKHYCWKVARLNNNSLDFEAISLPQKVRKQTFSGTLAKIDPEKLFRHIHDSHPVPSWPFRTKNGSLWTKDAKMHLLASGGAYKPGHFENTILTGGVYRSIALIPFEVDEAGEGILQFCSSGPNFFTRDKIEFYERVAQVLGIALVNRRVQAALQERIKELTCLYSIFQLSERPDRSLEEVLQGIVELLPPAWQYSDVAFARIIFDGRSYSLSGFPEGGDTQVAYIIVNGKRRGTLEVTYAVNKPELDEGPFLNEERKLIETIARELARIIAHRLYEDEKAKLVDQLRHTDRLAIIGQLSAAVAHEINEPLANVLGFAQLAMKCKDLPKQASEDIEKIVAASLHSREIVRKLLAFARQMPPKKSKISLNKVVEDVFHFLGSRCAKEGIDLEQSLSSDLQDIIADPGQLRQVLANLVVNSMHAMTRGGKLRIETFQSKDHVSLVVEDTGCGMTEEVRVRIFIPFFTTKDEDQGTGLGLPVVHGIVIAHGGSIQIESKVGYGTRFEIRLPVNVTERTEKEGNPFD